MVKYIIFDLDMTLVDTSCLDDYRHNRQWSLAYQNIPNTRLFEGMPEVFEYIRANNIKVAVVSTSPGTYVERIVRYHNIPCTCIVGYHDAQPIKPHPAPMLKALQVLGCQAKDAISFGDRVIDIKASNGAGIGSVACFWGTKEPDALLRSGYSRAIAKAGEILNLIR